MQNLHALRRPPAVSYLVRRFEHKDGISVSRKSVSDAPQVFSQALVRSQCAASDHRLAARPCRRTQCPAPNGRRQRPTSDNAQKARLVQD